MSYTYIEQDDFKPRKFEVIVGSFTEAFILYDIVRDGIRRRKELDATVPEEINRLHDELEKRLTK